MRVGGERHRHQFLCQAKNVTIVDVGSDGGHLRGDQRRHCEARPVLALPVDGNTASKILVQDGTDGHLGHELRDSETAPAADLFRQELVETVDQVNTDAKRIELLCWLDARPLTAGVDPIPRKQQLERPSAVASKLWGVR